MELGSYPSDDSHAAHPFTPMRSPNLTFHARHLIRSQLYLIPSSPLLHLRVLPVPAYRRTDSRIRSPEQARHGEHQFTMSSSPLPIRHDMHSRTFASCCSSGRLEWYAPFPKTMKEGRGQNQSRPATAQLLSSHDLWCLRAGRLFTVVKEGGRWTAADG